MKKVYLSGQINRVSAKTVARSKEELNLISRRILLGNAIPIVPSLWFFGYDRDPRLDKTPKWWVEKVFVDLMRMCDIFCYKQSLVGTEDEVSFLEKSAWKQLFPDRPLVSSDVILDFLLKCNAKEVFGDIRGVC